MAFIRSYKYMYCLYSFTGETYFEFLKTCTVVVAIVKMTFDFFFSQVHILFQYTGTLNFFFTKLVFGSFPLGDFSIQDLKDKQ